MSGKDTPRNNPHPNNKGRVKESRITIGESGDVTAPQPRPRDYVQQQQGNRTCDIREKQAREQSNDLGTPPAQDGQTLEHLRGHFGRYGDILGAFA